MVLRSSIAFFLLITLTTAAKILLLPANGVSHVRQHTLFGEDLLDKGHEVHMVLSRSYPDLEKVQKGRIKVMTSHTPEKDFYMVASSQDDMDKFMEVIMDTSTITDLRTNAEKGGIQMCRNPLSDEALFQKIKAENYDLAILDAFLYSRCSGIWIYRLDIPFVAQTTVYEPWLLANPSVPSVTPLNFDKPPMGEKMSFTERVWNLWVILDFVLYPRNPYTDVELTRKYAPEMPPISMDAFVSKASLWLVEQDFALDYPRPVMPNEILIGGLATKPAKPLSAEFQTYMDSANEHGVIIVSFGSFSMNLPLAARMHMFDAFRAVKQHVVWRYLDKRPEGLPDRIKLVDWLPQNDLLGHKNTKLFITHCGGSGQFEGLYHGVPMINMPLFGDQQYNALRSENKGYSITMDVRTLTSDQLVDTINRILSNAVYREKVKKGSAVFRSQPITPRERAIYWIEHVLTYGGDHLRSHALDMPGYQWLMIDIIAPVLLLMHLIPLGIWLVCKRCFRY